ncbi:MAG: hypothetical protein ACE14M_07745 [Terriglobales bacterium]
MAESAHVPTISPEASGGAIASVAPQQEEPLWARLVMPSISDIVFVALVCALTFGIWGPQLLSDADIGWHIRNGEHILATRSVPHTDYFSYTMVGQPWFAWEWLYDLVISSVHSVDGLNGVVIFSGVVIALTLALLFRLALKSSGNLLVALSLTLLSGAAASVHFLARPHVLSWLFTLIWAQTLRSFQRGERKHVWILLPLTVLWTNLHGGFLVGFALLGLYLAGNVWTWCTTSCPESRSRATGRVRRLGMLLPLSVAASVVNPYGYRLYMHLYEYLSSSFLMDNIMEFLSPNFHLLQVKCFAALLVLMLLALSVSVSKVSAADVLTLAFATWIGLYAARNVPIGSILITLTIAPILGTAIRNVPDQSNVTCWLRGLASKLETFSARMKAMELRFNSHLLAAVVLALVVAIGISGHRASGQKLISPNTRKADAQAPLLSLYFDEKQMPVHAAEYMASHDISTHFFAPDEWSGYLIYRLYPNVRVMFDDRHDLYGEKSVREYLKLTHVGYGWRDVLDKNKVNWVLLRPDSPLANTLKAAGDWKTIYDDGTAILFARAMPLTS